MSEEAVLLGCGGVTQSEYCLNYWNIVVFWKCQNLHTGWQNVTTQMIRIFKVAVMRVSDHTSHLCSACAGHLNYW